MIIVRMRGFIRGGKVGMFYDFFLSFMFYFLKVFKRKKGGEEFNIYFIC